MPYIAAQSDLETIIKRIRRITRSADINLLTDQEIVQHLNTFILYRMPQQLRLFDLRTDFEFTTIPNVDRYSTTTLDDASPLYNFKNKFRNVYPGVYIAGISAFYTQKPDIFFGYYPPTNYTTNAVPTNGGASYNGTTQQVPILQYSVVISALDVNNNPMSFMDKPQPYPNAVTTGDLVMNPKLPTTGNNTPVGTINYLTGQWSITFPQAAKAGLAVEVSYIFYNPGKPYAMLFFDDEFVLRPVPDRVYTVKMQADRLPSQLLNEGQHPDIDQWWEFLAAGTSRIIFEERMDLDSIAKLDPIFRELEMLAQRSTLCEAVNERTTTLYTVGKKFGLGYFSLGPWPY